MLYGNLRVPIPEHNIYVTGLYVYEYVSPWKTETGDRNNKRRKKLIGKLPSLAALAENGDRLMIPSDKYYELRGLSQPNNEIDWAQVKLPGRRSNVSGNKSGSVKTTLFHFLACFALKELGVFDILNKIFGLETACQISFVASFYAAGRQSLDHFDVETDRCSILSPCQGMTSQAASVLFARGLPPEKRKDFFKEWLPMVCKGHSLAYDVTSFSTMSKSIGSAEYGYNRDHEELKQINFAFLCNEETNLPVFYVKYPGSINDKANLITVLNQLKERKIPDDVTFIMDCGFASTDNINFMLEQDINFVMGVPIDSWTSVKEAVRTWLASEHSPSESYITDLNFDGDESCHVYDSTTINYEWRGHPIKLHIYRGLDRYSLEQTQLCRNIEICNAELLRSGKLPQGAFYAEAASCYDKQGKGRETKWVLNKERLDDKYRTMSCFALFSSPKLNFNAKQALIRYRWKDADEKLFDCLKNEIGMRRMLVHGDAVLDGKLFVLFIATLIRKALFNECEDYLKEVGGSFSTIVDVLASREQEVDDKGNLVYCSALPSKVRRLMDHIIRNHSIKTAKYDPGFGVKRRISGNSF